MGIADMDFKVAPVVTQALVERIHHENYGYLTIPASHVESLVNWNKRRYGLEINPSWILHSPSVHPAIVSVLRAFSPPGTKVIVQSPTYNGFYGDITAVGCKAEENPLKLVNGRYAMDFEDLERRIDHDTNTIILCNPQGDGGSGQQEEGAWCGRRHAGDDPRALPGRARQSTDERRVILRLRQRGAYADELRDATQTPRAGDDQHGQRVEQGLSPPAALRGTRATAPRPRSIP
jgi:hypothetical protein